MRTLDQIKEEIDSLSERRIEVMRALSEGYDATLAAEHQELEEQIAQLWEEQRNARALLRFGDRDVIIQRARQEERPFPAPPSGSGRTRRGAPGCRAPRVSHRNTGGGGGGGGGGRGGGAGGGGGGGGGGRGPPLYLRVTVMVWLLPPR